MRMFEGSSEGSLSGIIEVIMVDAPASGVRRIVKNINLCNVGGDNFLSVIFRNQGSGRRLVHDLNFPSGNTVVFGEQDMYVLDSIGKRITGKMKNVAVGENAEWVTAWADIMS